jgi:hypothetical protein
MMDHPRSLHIKLGLKFRRVNTLQVSISSTFYVRIFCMNVVSAAFSSYILPLLKNLYEKRARITCTYLVNGEQIWQNSTQLFGKIQKFQSWRN